MKILSLFNNKGGVGKTTLTYHLAHILAEPTETGGCGKKVLLIDADPQCNLSIFSLKAEELDKIWQKEKKFLEPQGGNYAGAREEAIKGGTFDALLEETRSLHFLLAPTSQGQTDEVKLSPPRDLNKTGSLGLIPGRMSMHRYEADIAKRWSGAFLGEDLSIRTITKVRQLAIDYAGKYEYDYVIIDTSPSLGALNKVLVSMADAFIIPCFPDLFSSYGIQNIGLSLQEWSRDFNTMYHLLNSETRSKFPDQFVQFLGYTIFNAKKYSSQNQSANGYNLSQAHYFYVEKFPEIIKEYIKVNKPIPDNILVKPIGESAIMHTHNTFPSQAQKYTCPMWEVPNTDLDESDKSNVKGNQGRYFETKEAYKKFADDLLERFKYVEQSSSLPSTQSV